MSIQSSRWISGQSVQHRRIEPNSKKLLAAGAIPSGLPSCGCDLRILCKFKIFTNVNSATMDSEALDEWLFVPAWADTRMALPDSFALARSIEFFCVPKDVFSICVGKSTDERC
jgi:deoxycytidine triphosphate deaminase